MKTIFDVAVIGLGGMGSSICANLSQQGCNVLGLEQFGAVHQNGSSHGRTRIIRETYFEHPNYVPLVRESFQLWRELESQTGQQLLSQTGLLQAGPPESEVIKGVRASSIEHQIKVEELSATDVKDQFPQFSLDSDWDCLYESSAGFLEVEAALETLQTLARQNNATLLFDCPLKSWKQVSEGFLLQTPKEDFLAKRLVFSTGKWIAATALPKQLSFQVLLKFVSWFRGAAERLSLSNNSPVFLFETKQGCFYGFPSRDSEGMKLAEHSGGVSMSETKMPSEQDLARLQSEDLHRIKDFASRHLRSQDLTVCDQQRCYYTMSPDGHFLIDRHPDFEEVFLVGGFSGHGFKFLPVIGKRLTEAILQGIWDERMKFLSIKRLTNHSS